MKLAVFGANGPTGRLLTRLALDEDHDVVAFTRHPDAFPIEHRRLEVVAGDVHDARRGRRRRSTGPTPCSRRSACRSPRPRSPSTRTASPTSSPACTPPASSGSRASAPARSARTPSRSAASSSRRSCSPTSSTSSARPCTTTCGGWRRWCPTAISAWTIVRPSGLFEAPAVSGVRRRDRLTSAYRFTARIDLADCLLRQALDDTYVRADDRGGDAERQAVDAEADLAGRHPQEGVSRHVPASRTDTMGTAMDRPDHTAGRRRPGVHRALGRRTDAGCSISPSACCSTCGDAEDVVQEAFTRLARTDIADIDDPEGWLVVVTSRLCLDRLRTPAAPPDRRARRRRRLRSTRTRSIRRATSRSSTTSPWRCTPCSNG